MKKTAPGYTLIELLIVMVIVALLATIIVQRILPGVTIKARDAKRLSDLETISKAIDSYSSDKGFLPPQINQGVSGWTCGITVSSYSQCNILQADLKPYLIALPFDPLDKPILGGNINCSEAPCYMYSTEPQNHTNYCLCAKLEGEPPQNKSNYCSNLVSYGNYCISNTSN